MLTFLSGKMELFTAFLSIRPEKQQDATYSLSAPGYFVEASITRAMFRRETCNIHGLRKRIFVVFPDEGVLRQPGQKRGQRHN